MNARLAAVQRERAGGLSSEKQRFWFLEGSSTAPLVRGRWERGSCRGGGEKGGNQMSGIEGELRQKHAKTVTVTAMPAAGSIHFAFRSRVYHECPRLNRERSLPLASHNKQPPPPLHATASPCWHARRCRHTHTRNERTNSRGLLYRKGYARAKQKFVNPLFFLDATFRLAVITDCW